MAEAPLKGDARQQNSRALAARLLQQLQSGRSLTELFDELPAAVEPRDAGLIKELCFGVARWWPRLEAISALLVRRPLKGRDNDIKALILIGLHQLMHLRVAQHAALAETVEAARLLQKPWAAGLVNAVLRRFQREQRQLLEEADRSPTARHAHPGWLLEALQQAWPERWPEVVEANNARPPMGLRVNRRRISRRQYAALLAEASLPARPIPGAPDGLVLDTPRPAPTLPGFADGLVSVQDGGAQLAAPLLRLAPGQQVLDACAAPGGKSAHLLECAPEGVALTALDISPARLVRVSETLARLGLQADVQVGDIGAPGGAWASRRYERILLDVPCSATGVIRRHPDIKLLRQPGDIAQLVAAQRAILAAAWPLLQPGGVLLYATCSVLPQENQQQVERFLEQQPDAGTEPIDADWGRPAGPGRQLLPGDNGMDGFFYARLVKR